MAYASPTSEALKAWQAEARLRLHNGGAEELDLDS
jgi:hypothetical protein